MNHDIETPAQAEAEAEQARAGLVNTLAQLRENLKPANVVDEVMSAAKVNTSAITDQILDSARRNPLPAIMIGAGLAMIFGFGGRYALGASAPAPRQPDEGAVPPPAPRWAPSDSPARTTAGPAVARAHDALDVAGARVGEAARNGKAALSSAYTHAKRSGPMNLSRRNVGSSLNKLVEEQPLVLAAVGVAIGAALGAALPRTELEDGLMGQTSGSVRGTAQAMAQDQLTQVKAAASHAVEDIKQTVADHGISADNIAGLVQDVGAKAKAATYEAGRAADPTT